MNSRERSVAAMRGLTPDRVPFVPLIDTSYAAACYGVPVSECFLKPETHARALQSCLERHPGIDGLSINIGITDDVVRERTHTADGWSITTLDSSLWAVPANDIGTPVRHEITRFDDERLASLDVLRPHIIETLRHFHPALREQYNISVGLTGPFSQVAFMMGVANVLTAMIDHPEELKTAIQHRVPFAIAWAEHAAEMGAPSVWIGEGVASGSMIAAAQYVNFVLPFEQQVTRKLRELGVPVALHICGKADNLLAEMARSGADCLEIDWQVDLAAAKACVGSQVSLKGNLHTTRLTQSSPMEVYEDARRDTPPENVAAMAQAASDFGIY